MASEHDLLITAPDNPHTLILAHGAGAPMDSDFMESLASLLGERGICVVRFEFPYMAARRVDGKKRGPNGKKILTKTWREVIASVREARDIDADELFIGGKSMGGRYASMIADDAGVAGAILLGYPFHPPGKPEKLRTEHLESLATPMLCVQGERDPFGTTEEVETYALSERFQLLWMPDGDHSLKPRKRSGHTQQEHLSAAADAIARFMLGEARVRG